MKDIATKKEQKRAESDGRILQAAAKVFGSMGYSRATLTLIAEEAGVSQGLVSQRFCSKENLLNEVFEQTQILSFYDENNSHLPQAFYVLIDQLKKEVKEEPEWFRFLSIIHTGTDTPTGFEERTKEMFTSTPLFSAIVEAQAQEDLPPGEPWDIFRVFFRNATNLIGWYHEFGLPMPENEYFLYAIQYNRRQKDADAVLKRKNFEIQSLQNDRDILFVAVAEIYPLIIFGNLSRNSYYMLEYENFTTKRAAKRGKYDELIGVGVSTIPNEIHREQFLRLFNRNSVIRAYENGKHQLCLRHLQTGDGGVIRWIETRMLIKCCECGEIAVITLSRQIDDEMERLHMYGEALQNAEMAAGAKSRFLANLSHEIRTPMNAVIGYAEMIKHRKDQPEKVDAFAEKIRVSGKELMEMLSRALDAANLSFEGSSMDIKFNIDESSSGILSNAQKIAKQRGVSLEYSIGELRDSYIYVDEIRLQRCIMSLISRAINISMPGGCVRVMLDQLEDDDHKDKGRYRLTIHDAGVSVNNNLIRNILDKSSNTENIALDLERIQREIQALGGTIDFKGNENGNIIECIFLFRRGE